MARIRSLAGVALSAAMIGGVATALPVSNTAASPAAQARAVTRLAVATQWPSLVYGGGGVMVVGVSPGGSGSAGVKPPRLFLSSDMRPWRDVTPPQSQMRDNGSYGLFEQASFLSPSTGWVTSWNPGTVTTTIYRTDNGGKTWTTVRGGDDGGNAGAASLIDLVNRTTAFEEQLEPTSPGMSLSISTDAGQYWAKVYNGPSPTPPNGRPLGPFEMPMTFTDAHQGFAAVGVPPAATLIGEGNFFSTSDGGSTWQRQAPPLPDATVRCPTDVDLPAATSCLYTLPVFTGSRSGALGAVVTAGTHAEVAFDVTSDGGQEWGKASQVSARVTPNPTQGGLGGQPTFGYPLISLSSPSSWWVLGWTGSSASTEISTDNGDNWSTNRSSLPAGVPTSLNAFDSTQALLTVEDVSPDGATTQLLDTHDGGHHWVALHLLGVTGLVSP